MHYSFKTSTFSVSINTVNRQQIWSLVFPRGGDRTAAVVTISFRWLKKETKNEN